MWAARLSCIFILFGVTAGGGGWEPLGTPYFDNSTKREATAAVGQPAYLHCRVRNLADRASPGKRLVKDIKGWLSSGELFIGVGNLLCGFRLSKAEILSGPELFVRAGSDINLTCVAKHAPDPPSTQKESASVIVHVLSGERPAAMQSSGSTPPRLNRAILTTLVTLSTASQPRPALLLALPLAAQYVTIPTLLITILFVNAILRSLSKFTAASPVEPKSSR
ncbi:unnamed protein product [Chrysodeixis includens]|uniref:Ig-like domain-containing protein n=1 Tax=Chrysodeixis includens TaxID=689277 RepID=A0A9P0BQ26_CHRIL|nr:unnamed protein product [Chrysodeixis includens]